MGLQQIIKPTHVLQPTHSSCPTTSPGRIACLSIFSSTIGIDTLNSKTSGQFHSTKGNVVEAIGNVTGASSWTQSGKQEHAQGEAEYKAAQTKGYAEGTADRLGGKKDAIVGAVTGDRSQEAAGEFSLDSRQESLM